MDENLEKKSIKKNTEKNTPKNVTNVFHKIMANVNTAFVCHFP
jgi:hypothetical protein